VKALVSFTWAEIDLCSVSTVHLYCDDEGCWAEFE
jgi:hypothetical protein